MSLTVAPEDDETDLLGKRADALQENVIVGDNSISGELKYVTGYTGFSGKASEQSGNYLALKFEAEDGAETTVELLGGKLGHPVTLDSDMNIVLRITDPMQQKIRVVTTKGTSSTTKTYALNSLVLESAS